MSIEPPINPREIDPVIQSFFKTYKTDKIEPQEKEELFAFLNSVRDVPGFSLRTLVLGGFGYKDFEYKRLHSEWDRRRRKAAKEHQKDKEAEEEGLPKAASGKPQMIIKGATDTLFEEIQSIGALLVREYAKHAADRGETLKEFIMKAIDLREQWGDQIELLKQENDMLKTLSKMFVEVVKPEFKQMAGMRMYLDFITNLIRLKALGAEVDPTYIDNVTTRLEGVMGIRLT